MISDLQSALRSVEEFTTEQNLPPLKNLSLLRLFLALIRYRRSKNKRKISVHQTLLQSLEIIKKHSYSIRRWQQSSPEEKIQAQKAIKILNQYNDFILNEKIASKSWKARLFKFVSSEAADLNTISVPEIHSFSLSTREERLTEETSHNILATPFPNEIDALKMKALRIVKNSAPKPVQEHFLNLLKNLSPNFSARVLKNESPDTISFSQRLPSFLPNESTSFRGSFKRKGDKTSIPMPETFALTIQAHQTGFPHPLQYTGAGLGDHLIPSIHSHLQQFIPLHSFQKKKQSIAKKQLPNGSLYSKAKELLVEKEKIFNANVNKVIPLHIALANALTEEDLSSHFIPFQAATNPYHAFADAYQEIYVAFIENPALSLIQAWEKKPSAFNYKTAKQHLEKNTPNFKESKLPPLAKVLAQAGRELTLLRFAYPIGYPPPLISAFAHNIQIWAFKQALAFHEEIEAPSPEKTLTELMEEDVSFFKREDTSPLLFKEAEKLTNLLEEHAYSLSKGTIAPSA